MTTLRQAVHLAQLGSSLWLGRAIVNHAQLVGSHREIELFVNNVQSLNIPPANRMPGFCSGKPHVVQLAKFPKNLVGRPKQPYMATIPCHTGPLDAYLAIPFQGCMQTM